MREINLNGYIDDSVWFGDEITPEALHELLYEAGSDSSEDVHLRLNSYGGSCNAATRMHDDLAAYPGRIFCTVSGTAASAATVLAMAADRLEMTPGSLWMIHNPSVVAVGNEADLRDAIELLRACKESIINVYAKRCPLSRLNISDMMDKTTWMDAQTALMNGFIDNIAESAAGGPTDCLLNRAEAERKVQAWCDRHRLTPPARSAEKEKAPEEVVENAVEPTITPPTEPLEGEQTPNESRVLATTLETRLNNLKCQLIEGGNHEQDS